MVERLADVCEEHGRNEDAVELRKEADRSAATVKVSQTAEADRFYRDLNQRGIGVHVGMEAKGYLRWFERLLAELYRRA